MGPFVVSYGLDFVASISFFHVLFWAVPFPCVGL